ncbi:MAG: insulinase family protein [Bryobacterales bacterium]|nr:insulinase family protein [Bryobacterales bacterium]
MFLRTVAALFLACAAWAQQVPVEEFVLENGMKFLVVQRKDSPNVAAGWVAKVGSVNERPGVTGISHLFEHMMFKGTHAIGTRNIEEDLKINLELDRVYAAIREEEQDLARRKRLGEIENVKDPKVRTPRHQKLLEEFNRLNARQKELLVTNEFDRIYTSEGAAGMNAGTSQDFTIYYISVPANKLELWYWMEADRLVNPVFREFYSERDVVHEERRLRIDSTPTGKQMEEFNAMFWKSSPYSWPVIGWPSDLEAITREDANAYYNLNYAPNNLTACLVGNVDVAEAKKLAERYFGRLRRGPRDPEPVRTAEEESYTERRMVAYAEAPPQVVVRYHTVADGNRDEYALMVLAELLNDRTGRLYRSLVLEQQVANAAFAGSNGYKYEGYFELRGIAKPGKTPEEVEKALYGELEKLKNELVPDRELQKVKNQLAASNFRRLQADFALMVQLLIADVSRGWQTINTDPPLMQAVTPADIQRVAQRYFKPEGRSVMLLHTKRAAAKPSAGGAQ